MSEYQPKAFKHPRTGQSRTATSAAQEVALKFDGYRLVETKAEKPSTEPETPDTTSGDDPTAAPKPGPNLKQVRK